MNSLVNWLVENKITGGTTVMVIGGGFTQIGSTVLTQSALGAGLCASGGLMAFSGMLFVTIGVLKD